MINLTNTASPASPYFIERLLTVETCEKLISCADEKYRKATVAGTTQENRSSKIVWLNENEQADVYKHVRKSFVKLADLYGFEVDDMEPLQLAKYEPGDFYKWHLDIGSGKEERCRKLSMSIFLNDDYKGGILEFDGAKIDNFTQGSAVAFPSFLRHRVTKVTKGTRYSLVAWSRGAPFR